MPTQRTTKKTATKPAQRVTAAAPTLAEIMRELEKAGSEQTRKTYARHGVKDPMFGVSFATLKVLVKRIGVDHALAKELFETGNHDARVLAYKVADPAQVKPAELDRWAKSNTASMCGGYVAALAAESPHGMERAQKWLASKDAHMRACGWTLVGCLANLDESAGDEWFAERVQEIAENIHSVSNEERDAMNRTLITIGGRSSALRKAALAAAKHIGKVEVDHGDTSCKTPVAGPYIEKMWAHAAAKKFASPAAQERARESMRTRC